MRQAIRTSYRYMELSLDSAMMASIHGTFDETASNSASLGFDALDVA